MLPSKVMPHLLRLAAPLMDSLIVQLDSPLKQGKPFADYFNCKLIKSNSEQHAIFALALILLLMQNVISLPLSTLIVIIA